MSKKNQRKTDLEQNNQGQEKREVDARILGQILAAQNVIFALPDATRIAEFYSQTLLSIPGITACRVCLANESVQTGKMENNPCAQCEALRRGRDQSSILPADANFKCELTDQPDIRVIAIDSYLHHFGFFVFKVHDAADFDVYHPFISNLSNYVAITFENRLQKEQLQRAHHELEQRVDERTHDLALVNADLQREIAERRRTEEALRESEEQVRQLFDASPVATIVSGGGDEHVQWINNKFIELFGYTIEDMPDVEHWWTLAYPDETYREEMKRQWHADVAQAIQEKSQIKPMEAKVRCKDGSYRHIEFRLSSIGEKHLVTFVDLTERKRAEDELRQNREATLQFSEQLAALQDVTNELSKVESLDGLCLQAVLLGHSRLGFDRVSIWFIEEHLGIMRGSFGTDEHGGLRDERNAQVEFKHEGLGWLLFSHKESMALVEHRPLYDHLGRVVGEGDNALAALWDGDEVIGVVCVDNLFTRQPIREHQLEVLRLYATTLGHLIRRKRTENALWNSSQMLKLVLENMPAFVFWKDHNSVYLGCNKLFAANAGFDSPEKIIGLTDLDLPWKHTEAESYRADDRMVMESGIPKLNYEETQLTAEGQIMAVRTSKIPLRDQNGDIIGVLGTFEDITDRKKAEQALRESEWRYHEIFDNVLDGLYLLQVTEAGRFHVMEVNPAVERITGISYSSFLGKTPEEILPAEVAEMVNGKLLHCIEMGHPTEEEAELDLPVGRRNIYSTLIPAQDETGKVRRIIGISRDITEHKLAENALRESEEKYRLLHENAGVGIGYYKPDGRVISYNQLAASHMQGKPEDFEGKSIYEIFSSEEADLYMERIRSSLAADSSISYEDHLELPSGNKWFLSVFTKIQDAQQNAIGVQIISQDITEQKRAGEALRASENRFRVLSENAFVGIYIIQDGRLSYVNSTLAKIFGYTPEELTGAEPKVVIHPDDQATVSENIRRRIVGEVETVHYEFRGQCKDGGIKNIEVLGGRIDFGGKTAVIGNLMDITDRKRAEEEIARSLTAEKRARKVAEILRDANESLSRTLHLDDVLQNLLNYLMQLVPYDSANVMLREGDFHFRVVALRGYERWTDLDAAQKLVFDIRTIPSLSELVAAQKSIIIANTYEYPGWLRVPGTEHVVSWMGIPIIADGQVIGLYSVDKVEPAFFTDEQCLLAEGLAAQAAVAIQNTRLHDQITRSNVELEQRVASRTAQLEEANKELEAFAYSVSHDLRAPLRHIDGFIELLQKRVKTTIDDKSQHYMDVIADSARKMGTLIDDLLSFSRMGRKEMFRSQVDLNDLIQDIVDESKPETRGRNIQWKISPLPPVTGDQAMLRIVLVNLIANALKFTHSRKVAQIEIGYEDNENETVIFVRDNGVGFDMRYVDKLFGVFQRLHRQEDFEGTGIGLANVRRIISRHGGRTWAEGEIDHGATFYFSLPQPIHGQPLAKEAKIRSNNNLKGAE